MKDRDVLYDFDSVVYWLFDIKCMLIYLFGIDVIEYIF